MRTVGEILSAKRKEMGYSFEQIEKETKIRAKYLEAIEKNNFSGIAESAVIKGFIRNYSQFLGLPAENILAVFRRDFIENSKGQIIPRGMVESLAEKKFYWTPRLTFIALLLAVIGFFIFFFGRQYLRFSSPPFLEISSPAENQVAKEKVIVAGKTDKDASVKIDGILIAIAEDGSFQEEIVLPRGENVLTIEAANRQGKRTVLSRKVKVE